MADGDIRASSDEKERFLAKQLVAKAKAYASEGELYKSIKYFKQAYKITPTEKIKNRILRLKEAIEEDEDSEDNCGFIELDNGLVIFKKLVERLYPHQVEGVKWLFDLYQAQKKGGILADDMGLGKTLQIIAFISAMFDMQLIKNILLVLPLSVIPNWLKEFKDWAPGIRIECFHGPASKRMGVLRQCMMKRSVCITTYGLIITQWQALSKNVHGGEFVWDYIILDEGHRIKRPSKTTKRLHSIPSKNRIILTGTPIQNRVRDLWALMDWVTQGSILGTQKTFKTSYEIPIERARQRDATAPEIQLGNHMAESLRKLTEPYILRRTKEELLTENKENVQYLEKRDGNRDILVGNLHPSFPKLSTKNDFVVWVYLSETQEKIYRDFIQLDSVKALLATHRSPLVYLTILKKICDHPRLLPTRACLELGLESNNDSFSTDMELENLEDCAANRIDNISDETLINESAKLEFLIQLLLHLRDEGHRTLVFSLSRKMLNIIQRILINKKFKIMRLDGLVTKLKERERRVNLFQEDKSYDVFLLTTQVGGVGLTLTGADRVVIYDPSWNPATDAQSVDRIYRIGQKKSVVVYRLITCGSVEEKIYRRQIFKNSVIEQSTCGKKDPYRYFSRQDLAELFILDDVKTSTTQQQLQKLHSSQRKSEQSLVEHVEYLHTLKMFGLSDHDLMFSKKPDDFDYERDMAGGDFNNKVQEAQNRLRMESHQFTGYNEAELRWGAISVDNRGKDSTTKTNRNEPVYPIDGLSQKMNDLQLPEQFGSSFENSTSSSTENANSQSTLSSSDTETEKSDENDDDDNNIENSDSVNRDRLNSFFEANDKTRSHSPHSELQTTLPSTFQSHNKSQTSHKPNSSFFSNESLHDQQSTSNEHTSTPGQMNRKRLPSFDSDDDIILAVDTPDQEKSHFYTDQVSSMINENKLSSDDELILAVDSPLFQGKLKPTIQVTNTGTNDEVPTEIEDSLTIFSNSGSDVEGELNDSWKKAFSLHSSVALTPSQQDSPLIPPINRRRQVIESEGSDDEEKNYLQLNNGDSFADESKSSFNRKSHGLNSFNRTSMSNLSTLSLRISTSDREYDGADDVTEPYASNLNSSINDMKDASGRFTSQNTDKNSSNFNLCLSDFQDDDF